MLSMHHVSGNDPVLLASVKRGRLMKMKKRRLKAEEVLEEEAARRGTTPGQLRDIQGRLLSSVDTTRRQGVSAQTAGGRPAAKKRRTADGSAHAASLVGSGVDGIGAQAGRKRKAPRGDVDEGDDDADIAAAADAAGMAEAAATLGGASAAAAAAVARAAAAAAAEGDIDEDAINGEGESSDDGDGEDDEDEDEDEDDDEDDDEDMQPRKASAAARAK